jgi:hypothetical protein
MARLQTRMANGPALFALGLRTCQQERDLVMTNGPYLNLSYLHLGSEVINPNALDPCSCGESFAA